MRREFEQELRDSLYVHRPLPLHKERSLETSFPGKQVLAAQVLYNHETAIAEPAAAGTAQLTQADGILTIRAPLRADRWPEGAAPDGNYSNFGTARLEFAFQPTDWRGFNRLRFWVRPKIRGARILHLNVSVTNVGEIPLPDPYFRDGATVFDLENGQWEECIWEFAAMPRDAISQLSFYVFCSGHDICAGEELEYDFRDIVLEQVEHPEHEHGWQNPQPCIRLSTVGYWPAGIKTAVGTIPAERFCLVDAAREEAVFSADVRHVENERGSFDVLDFTPFTTPGTYYLLAGDLRSCEFEITEDLAAESLWKVINFFYCERCGFPVPGKHSTCHQDILAEHNGVKLTFAGAGTMPEMYPSRQPRPVKWFRPCLKMPAAASTTKCSICA